MRDISSEPTKSAVENREREYWEWLNIRQTGWKRGSTRLYIAVLRSLTSERRSPLPPQYKLIKVLFWAQRPKRLLKEACSEPRTRSELKRFFANYQ